jgi:transcriptional regulator with XRE-family HTH domain
LAKNTWISEIPTCHFQFNELLWAWEISVRPQHKTVLVEETSKRARPAEDDLAFLVGDEIKGLRKARRMTLAQLALQSGLSVGHLSQIERGLSTPSIKALHGISRALDVNISWFFSNSEPGPPEERDFIVRQSRRRQIRFDGGISDYLLTPSLQSDLELLMSTFAPGATSGSLPYTHDGEEAGIVMSGELDVWIDGKCFRLGQGDSFCFKSSLPHRYLNPGSIDTVVIWAITPPSY